MTTNNEFYFGKNSYKNMHEIVGLIKSLKTEAELTVFIEEYREYIQKLMGADVGDSTLSRFLQRNYPDDSQLIHGQLNIKAWKDPSQQIVETSEQAEIKRKRGRPPKNQE